MPSPIMVTMFSNRIVIGQYGLIRTAAPRLSATPSPPMMTGHKADTTLPNTTNNKISVTGKTRRSASTASVALVRRRS